jgi:MFS family permease
MLESLKLHYIEPVRSFNRAARLFLIMIIIDGVIYSAWQLFFNFYMLQSGFTREFLGLVNSMPSAAGLIFGIPLGRLSDRIGRRASIILGIALSSLFMLAEVTVRDPRLIAAAGFMNGASNMLFIISQAPLMAKLSDRGNRTMLFSLSFGFTTISAAVGALFAGQLPGLFGTLLGVQQDSATAYQAVLITSLLLGTTAIVPMWLMNEPRTLLESPQALQPPLDERGRIAAQPLGNLSPSLVATTARMALPQIVIGFGAAILIPYMNVFFKDQFNIRDSLLGLLFSLSSLLIGIGSILAPRLSTRLGGKIQAIVITQASSLVFLLLIGFAPFLWLSSVAYLLRTALMNMSAPLYSAFCMERTPERHHGLVNSILNLSWNIGWAVGPFVSGLVQEQYGFKPLFIATAILYGVASILTWAFFKHTEGLPELPQQTILQSQEYPE